VESITIDNSLSLEEKYFELIKQIEALLNKEDHIITNLANFIAALKQTFNKISWIGFYLFDGEKLYLGPFQGKIACTTIKIGQGVCGTAAQKKETIVVTDVDKFPGHIVCDPDSKSEIVIPVLKDNELFGVLDIDSNAYNSFNEIDKKHLEILAKYLTLKII
jgi:L-methionine (R)-S-oxide reductase